MDTVPETGSLFRVHGSCRNDLLNDDDVVDVDTKGVHKSGCWVIPQRQHMNE